MQGRPPSDVDHVCVRYSTKHVSTRLEAARFDAPLQLASPCDVIGLVAIGPLAYASSLFIYTLTQSRDTERTAFSLFSFYWFFTVLLVIIHNRINARNRKL